MAKRNSLGRGLGALIDNSNEGNENLKQEIAERQIVENINEISVSDILSVNPFQPRTRFDEESLQELSESIRQIGIIQPVTVRAVEEGKYQLISGERRLRASKLAGLEKIPAFIRIADDQALLEMALVENIQREDLDAIEIAISYQRLIEECDLTQEDLSGRVGKKRATVSNYLRLLKLPAEVQLGIRDRKLSMGHARTLITIDDPNIQLKVFNNIVEDELSVRKAEELVRNLTNPKHENEEKPAAEKPKEAEGQEYDELKSHLSQRFNAPIDLKRTPKGSGKIIISFASDEELERIIAILDK